MPTLLNAVATFPHFNLKRIFLLLLLISVLFVSCKKNTPDNVNEPLPVGTVLSSAMFQSNSHPVSGKVKIVQEINGTKSLVFENFSSDNGPDLRVWLSPNKNASPYTEAGILKAVTGNFSYTLPASFNHATNNHVLIWCEDFSVLFGHAVLQ